MSPELAMARQILLLTPMAGMTHQFQGHALNNGPKLIAILVVCDTIVARRMIVLPTTVLINSEVAPMNAERHEPTEDQRRALRAVANVVRLAEPLIFDLWRSHELTLAQVQCLRILSKQSEQAGDLAKKLSMSSTSLTRILERLESREMVERIIDRHDRRRIRVQLTNTGRQTVGSLTSWYHSALFKAIQDMTPTQLQQLTTVLDTYSQSVSLCEQVEMGTPSPISSEQLR